MDIRAVVVRDRGDGRRRAEHHVVTRKEARPLPLLGAAALVDLLIEAGCHSRPPRLKSLMRQVVRAEA